MSKTRTKSGIKMLAAHAKERLKNGFYDKSNNCDNYSGFIKSGMDDRLSESDRQFYEKVKSIIEEGDVINPLLRLVDQEYINSLSFNARQRYLLEISEKYNRIKEHILRSMNENIPV